jgi:hypothetical protein
MYPDKHDTPQVAGWVVPAPVLPKIGQVKSNLRRWSPLEWILFWGVVPAILLLVWALPQAVRDDWFILDTVSPWKVGTWFLSSYAHSELYPHLLGNLVFYSIVLLMIFAFEEDRRRFRLLAGWSFLAVPVVSSLLTILFWDLIGRTTTGQGFSAVTGALLAYAMFIFVIWGVGEGLVVLDRPELFTGSRARFLVVKILLAVILSLIVVMGLMTGVFMDVGDSVSNGIAHFGGFITALVLLLLFDLKYEKRRYFDTMLAAAILVGILWYGYYLVKLVGVLTGG